MLRLGGLRLPVKRPMRIPLRIESGVTINGSGGIAARVCVGFDLCSSRILEVRACGIVESSLARNWPVTAQGSQSTPIKGAEVVGENAEGLRELNERGQKVL